MVSDRFRNRDLRQSAVMIFQGSCQEEEQPLEGEQPMEYLTASASWPTDDGPSNQGPQVVQQDGQPDQQPAQVGLTGGGAASPLIPFLWLLSMPKRCPYFSKRALRAKGKRWTTQAGTSFRASPSAL